MTRIVIGIAVAVLLGLGIVKGAGYAWREGERYFYEVALPRIVKQVGDAAQKAVQDGVRTGATGALRDATGGFLGGNPQIDPCRVPQQPAFGLPFGR